MSSNQLIRLTETVKKGGCAAKLPADELREVLGGLKLNSAPELLVGSATMDDAALWDLGNGQCLVQTLDFFTPIVDDPYEFGAIAAANAISDVYAMGGVPKTALTILAFPTATLSLDILRDLMRGAIDKIQESGAVLAGGHSIDDDTLKLGFSVTGFVERDRAWTNAGARPGDILILTKGLGTGTITSALKTQKAPELAIRAAIDSMLCLNRVPELLPKFSIHAATDITGFGLAGHLLQMMRASGASAEIDVHALPAIEGAIALLKEQVLNKAHRTNSRYVGDFVHYDQVPDELRWLTVDPQTSGGLLLSVDEKDAKEIVQSLRSRFPKVSAIGRVKAESGERRIEFVGF
jgi:selenide,water dikinase